MQRPPRWRVVHSPEFLQKARAYFPPGGSAGGRPSFEMFRTGPLRAAGLQFSLQVDELPLESGLYISQTVPTPFFAPIDFYAMLASDGDPVEIHIIDFDIDEDYWE